ncbi:MAG: 23S rRNA (pseudouridine(1915)-N(3))-methyltransferase RlmH [Deltaproteobacteria bacterium]|nr:23S rRNA (pseudouridine(1915)-N(3))-methyltransferase RlmH [Deltaproteobacteria bacterium]
MKLRIVAIGALKGSAERALCAEYLGRLTHYCKVEEVVLRPDTPAKEAAAIKKACEGANVVLMDERGVQLTSEKLARKLESLASRGKGEVALVIGGAHGLPAGLERELGGAVDRWSLSALTFPHRLARIVLCEQVYRAMTILRGEPYHH